MSDLRIGIIGAGGMGREHAENLHAIDGVTISMVADPVPDAAARLASRVGAETVIDGFALIGDQRADALVIASPDRTHADYANAAITAGKPTLCEKPLGDTVAQAQAVLDAEVEHGSRLVQVGLMRVYDRAHIELRADVATNGDITHVRAVHRNRNDFIRTVDHVISQSIVHDVHSVRWLTGQEFESVLTRFTMRPGGGARFVTVSARLSDHAMATFEFDDYAFGYDVSVEVTGQRGLARTPPPADPRLHDDWLAWFADAYRAEAEVWVASLREGAATGPSAWDGLAAQTVVGAMQASARSGHEEPVRLPPRPAMYAQRDPDHRGGDALSAT